jgi:hypothetical protein
MEEGNERIEGSTKNQRDDIASKVIRAGKRTYFFDVKSTQRDDFYVTITESKKRFNRDGRYFYEKHKIFLYREDFQKFMEGLQEMIDFVEAQPQSERPSFQKDNTYAFDENVDAKGSFPDFEEEPVTEPAYTNIDFEDLEEKR